MPWIRALPERVAFGSLSTELGEVKMCLYAFIEVINHSYHLATETYGYEYRIAE